MALSPEYLAEFFDGEGYVYLSSTKGHLGCIVGIANTHFNVLKMLQDRFGGTIHAKVRRKIQHSQGWEIRWGGQNAQHVLLTVLPFLIVKEKEVAYVLEHWFPIMKTGKGKTKKLTETEQQARTDVISTFKEIRALERKINQYEPVEVLA